MYTLWPVSPPPDITTGQAAPFVHLDGVWGARLSPQALEALRRHPRFLEAIELSVRSALVLQDTSALNTPHLKDGGRFFAGLLALYLHATGGLSLARLREACAQTGITSRGRVLAILAGLRVIGFIEPAPRAGDARIQLYRPTSGMVAAFRARIGVELRGAALISDIAALAAERFDDEAFFYALTTRIGEFLTLPLLLRNAVESPISIFSDRMAGTIILYALLAGGEPGDSFPPEGPVRMSIAGLAGRFKVSRTHVLRLLRDAEGRGLLRRDAEGVTGWLEPALRRESELLFQIAFALLIGAAEDVLKDAEAGRGTPDVGAD